MKEDTEGFLYPYVDQKVCIHCDICNKTCPVINSICEPGEKPDIFVAYCKEESLRLSSSSGGIFSLLAEDTLQRKGKVFGAAFDQDMMVHHIGITEKPEIDKLRGSKYLQSRIERTYIEAKKALQEQRNVLFSGTACQIAGLKKYLKREYENLITVDVLCHGTPTPKLWKKYLAWQELNAGSVIRDVSFRNKENGWKDYSLKVTFESRHVYNELFYKNSYMQLFLSDICLRPSCHDCKFKEINRPSDITLGDCWGIENYMPEMDDGKGTSLILIHSAKGRKMLDLIDGRLYKKEGDLDRILSPEADSMKSVKRHPKREEFFSKIDVMPMEELKRIVMPSVPRRMLNTVKKITKKLKYRIWHFS
jgi:coenzyme F420-reducing hydrogenase beta subunit